MAQTDDRFQADAGKYAAYLESPEGRLRLDLAFHNLQEFLPVPTRGQTIAALDLGCGTGVAGVRMVRLGLHVTLLDSSPAMLEIATRTAVDAGVMDRVTVRHGDAAELPTCFPAESFDVIVCHNLLEYLDDPAAVVRNAARLMRGPSAIFSVLVRNQAGEVLKSALNAGDLAGAERGLSAEWGEESLYGGKVRLFTSDTLHAIMKTASLTISAERGVRVVADYLPSKISPTVEYERILALERKLGERPEFTAIARYTQALVRRVPE